MFSLSISIGEFCECLYIGCVSSILNDLFMHVYVSVCIHVCFYGSVFLFYNSFTECFKLCEALIWLCKVIKNGFEHVDMCFSPISVSVCDPKGSSLIAYLCLLAASLTIINYTHTPHSLCMCVCVFSILLHDLFLKL